MIGLMWGGNNYRSNCANNWSCKTQNPAVLSRPPSHHRSCPVFVWFKSDGNRPHDVAPDQGQHVVASDLVFRDGSLLCFGIQKASIIHLCFCDCSNPDVCSRTREDHVCSRTRYVECGRHSWFLILDASSFIIDDYDWWLWLTIMIDDYDLWLWFMILIHDHDWWLWDMIMMYDYDLWLWFMIMNYDYDLWLGSPNPLR